MQGNSFETRREGKRGGGGLFYHQENVVFELSVVSVLAAITAWFASIILFLLKHPLLHLPFLSLPHTPSKRHGTPTVSLIPRRLTHTCIPPTVYQNITLRKVQSQITTRSRLAQRFLQITGMLWQGQGEQGRDPVLQKRN